MTGSEALNVVCVLRASAEYDAEYVGRLRDGVAKHLPTPHRFVCLSDVPVPCERVALAYNWPGWWSKLELFRPDMHGDILYFDLDTIPVGDLTEIAEPRGITMLEDFYQPDRLASGMMYLPWHERCEVWDTFIRDPERYIDAYLGHGDGGFLMEMFPAAYTWQEMCEGQVVSYKAHVRDKGVPDDARVVCFHGKPRPRAVNWSI